MAKNRTKKMSATLRREEIRKRIEALQVDIVEITSMCDDTEEADKLYLVLQRYAAMYFISHGISFDAWTKRLLPFWKDFEDAITPEAA